MTRFLKSFVYLVYIVVHVHNRRHDSFSEVFSIFLHTVQVSR